MPWHEVSDQRFVNPYQFVPLGDDVTRKSVSDWRGDPNERVTGVAHCSASVITPLSLPDYEKMELVGNEHKEAPFFRINGQPIIPGSELRGAIRSVFEAATNSCLSVCDDTKLSGRSFVVKTPGILQWDEATNEWKLYQTRSYLINTFKPGSERFAQYEIAYDQKGARIQINGQDKYTLDEIRFKVGNEYISRGYPIGSEAVLTGDGLVKHGILLLGEQGVPSNRRRHHSHVLELQDNPTYLSNHEALQKAVRNLETLLEKYRDPKTNLLQEKLKHPYYAGYGVDKRRPIPVFFTQIDGAIYLAPAMKSRDIYNRTLHAFIGKGHAPCDGRDDKICEACALFGRIGDAGGASFGSAVRFGDATLRKGGPRDTQRATLKELSSPKVTAVEFYTTKPVGVRADIWNYDYYTADRRVAEYASNESGPFVRGRKFYFHHQKPQYETTEQTERNMTTELLMPGAVFAFDVYFDGISKSELDRLLFCIAPKNGEKMLYHKLGTGKPLGLGSVDIKVNQVEIRSFEGGEYNVSDYQPGVAFGESVKKPAFRDLMKILDFHCIPKDMPICYPIGEDPRARENSKASHQWFAGNRSITPGSANNPIYYYLLPLLHDSDLSLPAMRNDDNVPTHASAAPAAPQRASSTMGENTMLVECIKCKKKKVAIRFSQIFDPSVTRICPDCLNADSSSRPPSARR